MQLKIDLKSVIIGAGVISALAFTQVPQDVNEKDFVRSIDVTGSAEMDVIPDEVEIKFTYTEWLDKSGKRMEESRIEKIEPIVLKSIKEAGVPEKDIRMASVSGHGNYYYYKRHHREDHVVSKTLSVCVSSVSTINKILKQFEANDLDERAISQIYVGEKDHQKLTEFRKKVKIDAVKAAKEKASYLLEAIGETAGKTLTIKEVNNDYSNNWWGNMRENTYSNEAVSSQSSSDGLAFSPINLRYEIMATFEIN